MISLDEFKREAAGTGVDVAVIEKDYVLSWILKGIFESSLAANLVFKGGTALRKVYFKDYRFSEDLDFTISKSIDINDLKSSIYPPSRLADFLSISGNPRQRSGFC